MPALAALVKPVLLLTAITALLGSSVIIRQSFDPPDTAFATFTVLTNVDGEVLVGSQGEFEQGSAGQSLLPGDTIRTGSGASASILFFDGSTVEMDENTEISLKDLLPPQGDSGLSISFTQNFGSTLNRVVSLSSPADSYEVDTPSGVASVRGTVFWVTNTDFSTLVEVDEGVVMLIGDGNEIPIRPGQVGMVIKGGQAFYVDADGEFIETQSPIPPGPPANPIARQNAAPVSQVAGVVESVEEQEQEQQQLPQGGVPQNDGNGNGGQLPPPPVFLQNDEPEQPPPPPFDDGNNGHGNDPPTNFDPSNPGQGGLGGGGNGPGNGNGNGNGNGIGNPNANALNQ